MATLHHRLDHLEEVTAARLMEARLRALEKAIRQLNDAEMLILAEANLQEAEYWFTVERVFSLLKADERRRLFGLDA